MSDLLRRAIADARLTEEDVAAHVGVDLKTVRRWLAGRLPYPRNRRTLAELLGSDEDYLWPHAATLRASLPDAPTPEILATYPHRWSVPRIAWQRHFESAQSEIGILAYAGLFLAEDSGLLRALATRAHDGVNVRIALGDPDGAHVPERGAEEGVNEAMAAKIRNALVLYRPLLAVPGIELRLHDTVLYNSIYRADRALLINPHIYGVAASHAPVVLIHYTHDGDMASVYLESFERIWGEATVLQ